MGKIKVQDATDGKSSQNIYKGRRRTEGNEKGTGSVAVMQELLSYFTFRGEGII